MSLEIGAEEALSLQDKREDMSHEADKVVNNENKSEALENKQIIVTPITPNNLELILGTGKGIQWYINSCYIDSTLFSMFAFNSAFDDLLDCEFPPNHPNMKIGKKLQKCLRVGIVNQLRKGTLVDGRIVMLIRQILAKWNPGFLSNQMEPQEFLYTLLREVFVYQPYLELDNGNGEDFFHNLLMGSPPPVPNTIYAPTLKHILEQSLKLQDVQFKRSKFPALMLPLPISFDMYNPFTAIIPNMSIDITEFINGKEAFKCINCSEPATCECANPDCVKWEQYFCDNCFGLQHQLCELEFHPKKKIKCEFHLSSIICAFPQYRHFISFVKCCPKPDADWVYFNSFDLDSKGPVVKHLKGFGLALKQLENNPSLIEPVLKHSNSYLQTMLRNPYMYFYVRN